MLSFFQKQDWFLNVAVLVLIGAGLVILSSMDGMLFWQQLAWLGISIIAMTACAFIDWRPLVNYRGVIFGIYILSVLLLVATYFLAPSIRGTHSWLVLGPVQFQTSEFAKVALIILLALFFAKRHVGIARFRVLFKSFAYFIIPAGLILIQPDLGTAIIVFCIWFGFLLVSGISWRHLFVGFLIMAALGVVGWNFFLKDYQKNRILAFANPDAYQLGANYNVIQSKIAIGSAGFLGKGYKQGTQVQLGFLPAASTDFIFSAFVEEWGGLGGLVVLSAFIFALFRIIKIGLEAQSNFSKLICLGAVMMFLSQFVINIGSVLGLLPVVGVTFPFFSYGGSSLMTNFMILGIIQSTVIRSSFLKNA